MTNQELFEAQRCFQHVCESIRIDGVSPRVVLFGTTLHDWLADDMKITIAGEPPNQSYKRLVLQSNNRLEPTIRRR